MTIEKIFKQVTTGMQYDISFANNQQKTLALKQIKAKEIPLLMSTSLKEEGRGCCLNFSLAMIHLLHEKGIEAYLAASPEINPDTGKRTHMHASVYYIQNGNGFFSDPVSAVKDGKENRFKISIQDFKEEMLLEGEVISIFDLYGENGEHNFFGDFTASPKTKFY